MEWTGQVYADSPVVAVQILIEAPPERVWSLVSDIALMAELSPELQEVAWLDGDPESPEVTGPAAGRRFTGRNAHPALGGGGAGQPGDRVRPAAPLRLGRRRSRPPGRDLAVHRDARRCGHPARAVVPDGPGPLRPEHRHRHDAGQGSQDRLRPAPRARGEHAAQPGRD